MANPASSTGANASPWFQAFKGPELQSYWGKVSRAYLQSPTKGGFRTAVKSASKDWLKASTNFERYLLSEVMTTWMGPVGEFAQAGMLAYFKKLGYQTDPKLLTAGQNLASKFLGFALFVGAGLTAMRLFNKMKHDEDDWKTPPRYKKAYSRLHSVENGGPFFGSGALNDNILRYGREQLDSANLTPRHTRVPVNPSRGGLPQELNRTANTHYLMGAAVHQHNARLFNI